MYKRLFLYCLVCFSLVNFVSAAHVITNILPEQNAECILTGNVSFKFYLSEEADGGCEFWSNDTGTFLLSSDGISGDFGFNTFTYYFDKPNTVLWRIGCANVTPPDVSYNPINSTFTITDAPYCATLSETTCPSTGYIGSEYVFKTRLGNTNGLWLENQDGNIWIEDSTGAIVKKFNSMGVNQESAIQLDSDGNWINTASPDTILTDSRGYYVYPFIVDSEWAYYGDELTVKAVLNGQETSCNFNVSKSKLPDVEHMEALGKEAGGVLTLILAGFIVLYILVKKGRGAL